VEPAAVERVVGDGHLGLVAGVVRVDHPDVDLLPQVPRVQVLRPHVPEADVVQGHQHRRPRARVYLKQTELTQSRVRYEQQCSYGPLASPQKTTYLDRASRDAVALVARTPAVLRPLAVVHPDDEEGVPVHVVALHPGVVVLEDELHEPAVRAVDDGPRDAPAAAAASPAARTTARSARPADPHRRPAPQQVRLRQVPPAHCHCPRRVNVNKTKERTRQ
jgi:hypothetical protein